MSTEEFIPGWAIELIKNVVQIKEKIPTHIEWVEKLMDDKENRIRALEEQNREFAVALEGLKREAIAVAILNKKMDVALKFIWTAMGGITVIAFFLKFT